MNTFKRIIIFVLCVLFMFSATGCGKDNSPEKQENGNDTPKMKETGFYLVENGTSEYKVVLPDSTKGYEKHAGKELVSNIRSATNVILPTISEKDAQVSENSKLIIVGDTNLAKTANIKADVNEFGRRGFVIKTVNSNVYLVGGDDTGSLYAVYEFLHYEFGYEPYAIDEIALEKGVKTKALYEFDIKEIPDIAHLQGVGPYWAWETKDIYAGHRMRFDQYDEVFIHATGQPWHNTFDYISPKVYNDPEKTETYHPKWFTSTKKQLHYTAHGDEAELNALRDEVFKKLTTAIDKDFTEGRYYEYIGFMQQDGTGWASSDEPFNEEGREDSVLKLKEKYGTAYPAAMLIRFINPVADKLKAYMTEKYPGRNMNITIFAYCDTEKAPTKEVDGKIMPIDEEVKLRDNVNVLVAPIYTDYIVEFKESGLQGEFDSWSKIADQMSMWYYNKYFSVNPNMYFDSTYSLQSFYKAAAEVNAKYLFNEANLGSKSCWTFGALQLYIMSKLGWDVDVNVNELVDNFFNNYYKDAKVGMREYFELLRTHIADLKENHEYSGVGSSNPEQTSYWPQGVLEMLMKKINKAKDEIEPLKTTDFVTYEKLEDRITYESLMPRYLMLKFYGDDAFSEKEFNEEVSQFKKDCKGFGIATFGRVSIDNLTFNR